MNTSHHSINRLKRLAGVTLVELTIGIMLALMIASATMATLSQQLNMTRMLRDQAFMLEDCPAINNLLSRMLGRIDSYRIYGSVDNAKGMGNGVMTGGRALLLSFRDSMDRMEFAIVAAETVDDGNVRLGIYNRTGGVWQDEPSWIISHQAQDVEFFVENGVLRVRLTGPNGEQITYSGHTQS